MLQHRVTKESKVKKNSGTSIENIPQEKLKRKHEQEDN
jgi:hypothetical protein